MTAYVIRRLLYTIPLVLGVCLFTFVLFEWIVPPEVRAAQAIGRHATAEAIQKEIRKRGWDKGLVWNARAEGVQRLTDTRFARHMSRLLLFRFGRTEKTHEDIGQAILRGMVPSLTLTLPIFVLGLFTGLCLSLGVAYVRGTVLDLAGVVVCVAFMSVSILVYIIVGQLLLAQYLRFFPIYGFARGFGVLRFLLLPVLIGVVKGLGDDVRFYRTILLEEMTRDYVRTARAKGLTETAVLFRHVLKNAMIPVLTRTVIAIPFLFLGSLLLESFFGIPGLGSMTVEAVNNGDTDVMAAMVYIGALLFAFGNLLTDISYTIADPRIRLQ
ncbi:MAG: ABC transporter permease [Candidatus Brocadiaceae bacterium]|nr:ABC transporter permease [Candidatus Brocadiaceae bacterium]